MRLKEHVIGQQSAKDAEQDFIDLLYRRLDRLRDQTRDLRDSYIRDFDGTPGGRVQRDIAYANHARALIDLNLAEDRLCFGRLDLAGGEDLHIGRMGMFSEGTDDRQLLMDWRAPSARVFYVATAAAPMGVVRRRHIRTKRRIVESASDEYLDLSQDALTLLGVTPDEVTEQQGLVSESALLAALNAPRTGRMADIIETIQGEQDRIIRADRAGVMVVQGGPGTGKTAVALHRAAYLLYTYRDQLANRGVLIIGPNSTFLRYIGEVLPSLGENAVVLSTVGSLFPGVNATAVDDPGVSIIKGRQSMAALIANALLDRQRMPRQPLDVAGDAGPFRLDPALLSKAQERAWGSRLPHNRARSIFLRTVIDQLARREAERNRVGLAAQIPFTSDDLEQARSDLREDEGLQSALAKIWPLLTPQRLLSELLSSPEQLAFAAPNMAEADRLLLVRPPGSPWTASDVPLLDEAAELIGALPVASTSGGDDRRAQADYAQAALDMLADQEFEVVDDSGQDASLLSMVTPGDLLEMQEDRVALTSTAERAAADREWTYGHVIVDEAQELSQMAWRMVVRRCPVRSMTLVGDIAQTGDPAGARSWAGVLRPLVGSSWRQEELTVNYRTPTEISAVADRVLARINPTLLAPQSVRSTGVHPWWLRVTAETLAGMTAAAVQRELAEARSAGLPERHIAVLAPNRLVPEITIAVSAVLADDLAGDQEADLGRRVVVLSVAEAKGLEFDIVILVEPKIIENASARGLSDLYVAVTRATQRLGVVFSGQRPWMAEPVRANPGADAVG